MRAFLWTLLATQVVALLAHANDLWNPQPRTRTADYVRRTALVGLLISGGSLLWIIRLLA